MHIKTGLWLLLLVITLLTGCGGKQFTQTIFQKRTPYEAYVQNLETAKLHQTALGKTWMAAGEKALQDSLLVQLPYQETGYFKAEQPTAASVAFRARQGEMLEVLVTTRTKQNIRLFLDLFETASGRPRTATHVAAADTTGLQLRYQAESDQVYLLRLQPELLSNGSYTTTIEAKPSLGFPVSGLDSRAVQSFWGADRDNGSRRHEGVDIFAAKGTPAIASAKGVVSRVAETPRGGKVVWLTDVNNRQNLYYAHLEQQLVQPGQQVNPGDTLGLVGNTGNARSTPPHLHFGIYSFGQGAVDPYPFIYQNTQQPATLKIDEKHLGSWARIAGKNAVLRNSPEGKAETVAKLPKSTAVQVLAGTSSWYKVQLPNGLTGFLHKDNLETLTKPLQTKTVKTDAELTELPSLTAMPIAALKKHTSFTVLGLFEAFQLVELSDGTLGWLPQT
ncbi:M23 family metallopeptidase [Adhaeribacter sp. BT258]|uniref:M23 family metallopeptidase n=1 Tax=Adhaeribacter terrigena TaxID=2793070 RepID=A0ABS1BYJ6_9BACT|nr:M23 family metallopeptidase [Adhaeribacter terrigena]MBK0402180.1 M23 family metallopeptidase [Adhaeribacter terrigena]